MIKLLFTYILICVTAAVKADDGYRLWLNYRPVDDKTQLIRYQELISCIKVYDSSPTLTAAADELRAGLSTLLQKNIPLTSQINKHGTIILGKHLVLPKPSFAESVYRSLGQEGFLISSQRINGFDCIVITAGTDIGLLYGAFHLLRMIQTQQPVSALNIFSAPRMKLRLLNHWDNLDRTVERGYAGFSIWNWHTLPVYIDKRYIDYARANASIGINGTVLTNVNANALVLTRTYLEKVKALADAFRPYGIKVYLTARFSAPIEIGQLKTADPLNDSVKNWWSEKAKEIYSLIPDFGGFLVKANSEGQPGPQDYKRTHADGANMLAAAVAPYKGIVIWRAFVYATENPDDRHKQAYNDFVPLDGKFRHNVMVQVKNGPIDFMPREPFHPMFGAMPKTPLMMEFQVTQEYLGQGTHLVYLAPLFKECLDSDTYSKGKGSTVAKIVNGTVDGHSLNGMAGVANIGTDINWTGHPFGQANWYCLGRLAWDHQLSPEQVADEWIRMTFSNDKDLVTDIRKIMLDSREIMVNYMNPLGLHHIMATGHHYGPGPWVNNLSRLEWNPVYYHRADSFGIGFNRTISGSNALGQYRDEAVTNWEDINTCDERYLLWFHHVSWKHKMKSGRTLWDEMCYKYYSGADSVKSLKEIWEKQKSRMDNERFQQVKMLLDIQYNEAKWWRNACLLYFQTFSKMPIPSQYEQPDKTLDYYKSLRFTFAPGN